MGAAKCYLHSAIRNQVSEMQMEQRVQTGPSEGGLFRDPPPRRQPKEVSDADTAQHPVISTRDARDAAVGHGARYVLGFGLVAIIVAFVVVYAVYFA